MKRQNIDLARKTTHEIWEYVNETSSSPEFWKLPVEQQKFYFDLMKIDMNYEMEFKNGELFRLTEQPSSAEAWMNSDTEEKRQLAEKTFEHRKFRRGYMRVWARERNVEVIECKW